LPPPKNVFAPKKFPCPNIDVAGYVHAQLSSLSTSDTQDLGASVWMLCRWELADVWFDQHSKSVRLYSRGHSERSVGAYRRVFRDTLSHAWMSRLTLTETRTSFVLL